MGIVLPLPTSIYMFWNAQIIIGRESTWGCGNVWRTTCVHVPMVISRIKKHGIERLIKFGMYRRRSICLSGSWTDCTWAASWWKRGRDHGIVGKYGGGEAQWYIDQAHEPYGVHYLYCDCWKFLERPRPRPRPPLRRPPHDPLFPTRPRH